MNTCNDTACDTKQQPAAAHEKLNRAVVYTPAVDIVETPEAFILNADLPGVRPVDLDIQFENGVLTIDANVQPRSPENGRLAWQEYGIGHYHRAFNITTQIDADNIRAELKNGELSVHVPKAQAARTRKIEVRQA
jgi:HSP20 family protein